MFVLLSLGISNTIYAEEDAGVKESNQGNNFSISPLDVKTEKPMGGFYDLTVNTNETIKLKVRLFNASKKEIVLNVQANDGNTNDNGITSYTDIKNEDKSLKVGFSSIAKVKSETVTVPANGQKDAEITITTPKEDFKGVILGGIRVTKEDDKEDKENKAAVVSKTAYTVGVLLSQKKEDIKPEINLLGVKTEQRNYRNYISANLQNAAPTIVRELKATMTIYQKSGKTPVYEVVNNDMRMAPNSNFYYGVNLEDKLFKPGKYTMILKGTADEIPFSFEEDFNITREEADNLNKNALYAEPEFNWWPYILSGILGFLVLMILFVVIYLYKKQRQKKLKQSKKRKNSNQIKKKRSKSE